MAVNYREVTRERMKAALNDWYYFDEDPDFWNADATDRVVERLTSDHVLGPLAIAVTQSIIADLVSMHNVGLEIRDAVAFLARQVDDSKIAHELVEPEPVECEASW